MLLNLKAKSPSSFLALITLSLGSHVAFCDDNSSADLHSTGIKILADHLLEIGDTSDLAWDPDSNTLTTRSVTKGSMPWGIYRIIEPKFNIYNLNPVEAALYNGGYEIRFIYPGKSTSREQCQRNAQDFIKNNFSWFFSLPDNPILYSEDIDENGCYLFRWLHLREDGLYNSRASCVVRSIDGKILSFSVIKVTNPWPDHKLSPIEAGKIAIAIVSKSDDKTRTLRNFRVLDYELSRNVTPDSNSPQGSHYDISLSASDINTGEIFVCSVRLDALSGKFVTLLDDWEPLRKSELDRKQGPLDSHPSWVGSQLIFVSDRRLVSTPTWATPVQQVLCRDSTGKIGALSADLSAAVSSSSGWGSWITVERDGWSYALNTKTGKYGVLGTPERRAFTPTIDSVGQWAVISTTSHSNNDDLDLYTTKLNTQADLGVRARLVLPQSDEHHPVFSPDGKWLYFISTKLVQGKSTNFLYRIHSNLTHVASITRIDKNLELVVSLPNFPSQRMSVSSDSKHILVQNTKGIILVDPILKKQRFIILRNLRDKQLGNSVIHNFSDAWSGPDNQEVTFSADTVDRSGLTHHRIYSCRFDGSNLRSWTPISDNPINTYYFKNGKTNSFDMSVILAKNEINWKISHTID